MKHVKLERDSLLVSIPAFAACLLAIAGVVALGWLIGRQWAAISLLVGK